MTLNDAIATNLYFTLPKYTNWLMVDNGIIVDVISRTPFIIPAKDLNNLNWQTRPVRLAELVIKKKFNATGKKTMTVINGLFQITYLGTTPASFTISFKEDI